MRTIVMILVLVGIPVPTLGARYCWVNNGEGRYIYTCRYQFTDFEAWMTRSFLHTKPDFWKDWPRSTHIEDRRP